MVQAPQVRETNASIANTDDLKEYASYATTYESDGNELDGFLCLPDGTGPFPGVLFNHGSSGLMSSNKPGFEALARLGYASFAAVRRGYNENPGTCWCDRITAPWGSSEMVEQLMVVFEEECRDVLAARDWLANHPQVDAQRIALIGASFGGVVTVLASEHSSMFRAGVSFTESAHPSSETCVLRDALLRSIRQSTIPLFLLQAQNAQGLEPTFTLGRELANLNKPYKVRVYPADRAKSADEHGIFGGCVELWGEDVQRFLDQCFV